MPKRCIIGCCSNIAKDGVALHKFPKDEKSKQIWTEFVQNTRADFLGPSATSVICSEHFSKDCYDSSYFVKESLGISCRKDILPGKYPSIKPLNSVLLMKTESSDNCSSSDKNPTVSSTNRGRKKIVVYKERLPEQTRNFVPIVTPLCNDAEKPQITVYGENGTSDQYEIAIEEGITSSHRCDIPQIVIKTEPQDEDILKEKAACFTDPMQARTTPVDARIEKSGNILQTVEIQPEESLWTNTAPIPCPVPVNLHGPVVDRWVTASRELQMGNQEFAKLLLDRYESTKDVISAIKAKRRRIMDYKD